MRTYKEILQGEDMMDFMMRQKSDFKLFCERVLGMTDYGGIHPFQMEWFYLAQNNSRVMIQAPSGFSKCLPGDVRIKTSSGFKTVKEISTGDTVFCANYKFKIEQTKIVAKLNNGKKDIYEIITRTGRKLRCTSNHPLLTINGYKSIDDNIKIGERVGITREYKNIETYNIPDSEIKLLAYMITEGGCKSSRFTNKDMLVIDDFNNKIIEQDLSLI